MTASVSFAGKTPWQRRVGKGFQVRHKLSYQQMTKDVWPEEPGFPTPIDAVRFAEAVGFLCGTMPPGRLEAVSQTILDAAATFQTDPFLVAALMSHQSDCLPRTPDRETRWGLTRIDVDMHAPHIRSSEYRYFVKRNGAWTQEALKMDKYRFNQWSAQKIEPNLYFAAAILSVLEKQCKDLDTLGGVPHRHFVSHWFFGDIVNDTEPEDAVLTVRRRLIAAYRKDGPKHAGNFNETSLVSPLDGTPRLLLDYFGNKRGGKKKDPGHQGIDISGLTGEPVRAVAAGKISFAGIDLPGEAQSRQTTQEEAAAVPRNTLGKGGLWITVNHKNGFRTCYMHLNSLAVKSGDTVQAGDIIGTLGNTGTVSSGPHLHLEFRTGNGEREDPAPFLKDILVDPRQASKAASTSSTPSTSSTN